MFGGWGSAGSDDQGREPQQGRAKHSEHRKDLKQGNQMSDEARTLAAGVLVSLACSCKAAAL